MKIIKNMTILAAMLGVILGVTIQLYAVEGQAVSMKASKNGKNIQIEIKIKKGFGIQKKGPHELAVFALKNNFLAKGNISKAFELEGKQVYESKPLKFSGKTSKEDDEYFSSIDSITAPVGVDGKKGIRARVFFCSFKDSFCSVETLNAILE